MKKNLILAASCLILFACSNKKEDKKTDDVKTTMSTDGKKPPAELLDLGVAAPVANALAAFSKGDLDGMVANYDDNIKYQWSNGDSLLGKQAVKDYYAGRWKLIESLSFSKEIKLPVQVNESQQPDAAPPGTWVLYWVMTHVKYKNGKELNFWQHSVNHLNDAGKIDYVGQYIDRYPIMEATKDLMPK